MKTNNRTLKAIAVIVVIGFGTMRNVDFKSAYSSFSTDISQNIELSDTTSATSDILLFSEVIIKSGINQILSNL